jgi:AcrR family transcriptional regulator
MTAAERREIVVERLAAHLLVEGLAGARLRQAAAAAGTSDRMLVYYFGSKEAMLGAVLERVARDFTGMLALAVPAGERLAPDALVAAAWAVMGSDAARPGVALWMELVAGAARGREPERGIAGAILDGFHAWVLDRLAVPPGADAEAAAWRVLATMEGMVLLAAAGRRPTPGG